MNFTVVRFRYKGGGVSIYRGDVFGFLVGYLDDVCSVGVEEEVVGVFFDV